MTIPRLNIKNGTGQINVPGLRLVPGTNLSVGADTTLDDRIRQGRDAWARLSRQNTFADWLIYGEGLQLGQESAIREAGAGVGQRYNRAIRAWLQRNDYGGKLDKSVRSKLLECVRNRDEILGWLAGLEESKRVRLNYPVTVLAAWQRATGRRPPAKRRDLRATLATIGFDAFLAAMPDEWREQLEARVVQQDAALALQRTSCKALTKSLVKIIKFAATGDVASIIGAANEITNKVGAEGRELKDIGIVFHRTTARRCSQ
jgi:hypothetical protein